MISITQTSHERLLLLGRVVVRLLEFGVAKSCLLVEHLACMTVAAWHVSHPAAACSSSGPASQPR